MSDKVKINRPGAPANPPQHLEGREPAPASKGAEKTRPTGVGTAQAGLDVSDPHPSDEEHPYDARHPGGANPPAKDIGPNNAIHDGHAPRRPDNKENSA